MAELKFTLQEEELNFGLSEDNLSFGLNVTSSIGDNYELLTNKPKINGVTLIGDKSSPDIHVQHEMDEITFQDIDEIIFGGN